MGKDYRIKGHRLLARCCYGSCLGFGFVITTITFAAMFWIIWCYLGFSFIHFSDTQRRALVNYPYPTSKNPTTSLPTSSPNNLEVSLNQIPNSSTATSNFQRNDSPSIPEKQRGLVQDRSFGLAKSNFDNSERNDKTPGRDTTTDELKRNPINSGIDIRPDSFEGRTVSPALHDEKSWKDKEDGTSNIHKSPPVSEMQETSTKRDNIQVEHSEIGKDDKTTSKSHLEDRKITDSIEFSNKQAEKDPSYIDPVFIRENSRFPNKEEPLSEYDSRAKSEPNSARNKNGSLPNEGRRILLDSELASSRDRHQIQTEDTYRDRLPNEKRSFDSDSDQRKYDDRYHDTDRRRYSVDQDDDSSSREIRRRDRVSEKQYFNERKRPNVQEDSSTRQDRYRGQNQDERYLEGRQRDNRQEYEERKRHRMPIDDKYDERYRDRIPVEDRYEERYRARVPVEDRYEERYRARAPVDDRYEERYRDRVPVDDRYEERYRDRVPIDDRYEERYRDRVPVDDKYDDRYRGRVPADDKYIERYPDQRRRRGDTLDSDDKRVREQRFRDRTVEEDRYLESERRISSDDKYEYRPQLDERDGDKVRKKGDDRIYETRSQDDKIRSRDEYDSRDDAKKKSSDDSLLDRRYDFREDAPRYRDRLDEEKVRLDRSREDNIQRPTSRDSYVDRSDNKEISRNRERIPPIPDTDYSRPSRTDDKKPIELSPPTESDLLSSRAEYQPPPIRTPPVRREYSTRNERKDYAYDVPDKEQSRSYSRDYNTEMRSDGSSESRYRNEYRNQEYQSRSRYDDRDRITPTRVSDGQYFSRDKIGEEDDFRTKSFNEDRRYDRDDRSRTPVRSTNHQINDDRSKMTRIDSSIDKSITSYRDRKTELPKESGNTRSEYDLKTTDEKRAEEVVLDRRSYSTEEDYNGRNRKFENPVDSKDRIYRPTNLERRDYQYEDSSSRSNDKVDMYRPSRPTEYEAKDYPIRGSNSRNRDIRYDKERDSNVRVQDSDRDRYNRDRDIYRDSPLGSEETSKQNRERVDEGRYDEKYETRSYDRYPSSDGGIRKVDNITPMRKDSAWDENPQPRNRRNDPPNNRDDSPPRGNSGNLKVETRYSDEKYSMESRRDRNPSPLNRDSESQKRTEHSPSNNDQLASRVELTRGVSHVVSSNYDPEQPLSAKDVIDAALRHSEIPEHTAKKVFYPVFDPRVSNLTSPDTIRPSERRGITVTAKKRRKR